MSQILDESSVQSCAGVRQGEERRVNVDQTLVEHLQSENVISWGNTEDMAQDQQ